MAHLARTRDPEIGHRRRVTWGRLVGATAIAAAAAVASTATLYGTSRAAGLVDTGVVMPSLFGMAPLSLASVSLTALVAALGAGLLLAALAATTRRPIRIFRAVASVLALVSLSMPATVPGPQPGMRLVMAAMHVLVWLVCAGALPALAGRPRGAA